ncbi:MAG: hypothetical protein DRO11_07950, partial [Methanobacteriota archaeon]
MKTCDETYDLRTCGDNYTGNYSEFSQVDCGGEGTAANPFKIYDCEGLSEMRNDLDAYYEIMNDIDCYMT